jgi:hypothetical protein
MAKKKFELNRKEYLKIKKMDHNQMHLWAEKIYRNGFEDGEKAADKGALTFEDVHDALADIKGLGEKRISAIHEALEKKMMIKTNRELYEI